MAAITDDPLVTTDWLAAHLDDANVKIVDASFKMPGVLPLAKDDYLKAH
ncbi:MAG: sulfurtransferase, partial [Bradyrhizobium sp.]|nr:sulfurtransferase [Bradyrhizobium sp.]